MDEDVVVVNPHQYKSALGEEVQGCSDGSDRKKHLTNPTSSSSTDGIKSSEYHAGSSSKEADGREKINDRVRNTECVNTKVNIQRAYQNTINKARFSLK